MKISIHPLFFLFGIYFALTGKVFLFLSFTLTALVHELGHAVAGERLGYKMNKISLMPYGAVVNGNIDGLLYKDEIKIALSGPLYNLAICIFFTCLWWLIPESYPYLESVVFTNLCVFAINLLPAYPLDGGRILSATLSLYIPRKKSMLITKIIGLVISAIILGLFIYSVVINQMNISLLFFCAFIAVGSVQKTKENAYVRAFLRQNNSLKKIKECKTLLLYKDLTLKDLIALTDGSYCFFLIICDKNSQRFITLDFNQTQELLCSYRLYDKVEQILVDLFPNKAKELNSG